MLYLLLTLLQLLQKLFRRLHVLLSVLLLLIVGGGLIIGLVLIGLIVRLRVIRGVGGVVGCVILRVLTFDNDRVSAWSSLWRGGHRCSRTRRERLVVGSRLLSRGLRIAFNRTARFGHQDHTIQGAGISRRAQQNIVEVRSIQERSQHVASRARAKTSDNAFGRRAGEVDSGAGLRSYLF